jgi:hypothetical protein
MTLKLAIEAVQGTSTTSHADASATPIGRIVASDLMSDVLVVHDDDILLVTSLVSEQVVRTADLISAAGIIIVNGKTIPAQTQSLADDLDVPLVRSPLAKFEACIALGAALTEPPAPKATP